MATATPHSIAVAIPVAAPPSVEINTPRWLTIWTALVWMFGIAFMIISIVAVREHRGALKSIASDSAKSVVAAETIASALADMDANAANGLLMSPQSKERDKAVVDFGKSRSQMTDALVDAARNITFAGEESEIKALARNSGSYSELVGAAFTLQNSSAAKALEKYTAAAQLLDNTLVPGALKVDKINRDALDDSFKSINQNSTIASVAVWISGLGFLGALLKIQFFLSERMRRTLNPLCLLATVLAGGLLLYTSHALSTASQQIRVVKADAFDSIHALWQAKATAYNVNALESRYLLDKASSAKYDKGFLDLSKRMASDPEKLKRGTPSPGSEAFLDKELANITFKGERAAALKAVDWWSQYMQIDNRIRTLESSGKHDQAVQLCLGEGKGESNWAFGNFSVALDEVLKINQDAFDQATSTGFEVLERFEAIAIVMGLLAALACLFGVLPRIREYSV